ncbi:hypothetical protein T12_3594 [Trichinella patagoniensis]|uniref:Uncharacterized protein n=1 Tax=Trichinella patagoniensis TaxID=990121 RepID=A0A0V0YUC2_9BILA|nr:hypothetical protein T12_3594 [Trichinella patagoniensis]
MVVNRNTSKMKKLPPEEEAIEQKRIVMKWEFYKVPFKESVALLSQMTRM